MKITVTGINPRNDDDSDVINVTVHISDPKSSNRIRNAELRIFVSKNKKTLEEINQEAESQALAFLTEIVVQHKA